MILNTESGAQLCAPTGGGDGSRSGWRRMGPGRSGRAYSRVCGAATAKGSEHVRVMRRQDPRQRKNRAQPLCDSLAWTSSWVSPVMRTTLLRERSPWMMARREGARSSSLARKARQASLASPSTGGAVNRILSVSPTRPATSLREARGWTRMDSVACGWTAALPATGDILEGAFAHQGVHVHLLHLDHLGEGL